MRYWIDVEDSNGAVLGSGPITSATDFENLARMNAAGTFSFTMPIKDPKSELIQDLRVIRCYGIMDQQVVELGAGVIKHIEINEAPETGQITLRVAGDDLLSELANLRVSELKLYNRRARHAWKSSWYQPNETDMPQTYDNAVGDTSNYYSITNWDLGSDAGGNFWYIGFPRHFDTIHIKLGPTVNVVESDEWHVQYFDPGEFGWIDLDISENTTITGANKDIWLGQDGLISFSIPPNWGIEGLYHGPLYEVRIMHSFGNTFNIDLADVAVSYDEPTQDALQFIMDQAPTNWALDDVNGYTQTQSPLLVSDNAVLNGDFADFGGTADDATTDTFTSWTNVGVDGSNLIEAITTTTGYAVQLTAATALTPQIYQEFTVDPLTDYRFRFYTLSDGSSEVVYGFYEANTGRYLARAIYSGITATTWTLVEERISIPPETTTLRVTFMNTVGVAAVRDVEMAQYISGEVYMELSGETVLEALNRLAEQTGENFIRSYAGRRVLWLGRDKRVADVRALAGGDHIAQEGHAELVRITNITERQDAYELATRVYVYGGDVGASRVTLATCTRQPPTGYALDKTNNYLERSSAAGGTIEKLLEFTDVVPSDSSQSVIGYSSNTIFDRAYEWLKRHSALDTTRVTGDVPRAYDLEVTKVERIIYPGHALHVVYYRAVDGVPVINVDQYLWIISVVQRIDSNGSLAVSLEVSTVDAAIQDDNTALVDAIRTLSANNRRTQVPRSEASGQIITTYTSHNAVALDTNADTVLSISTQTLGLDTQIANRGWFGPTTGAAAIPTFRAPVSADIPTLDHGTKLTGLGDDDHTQYLLAAGTRALTGNWDAGSFEIRAQTFQSDVTTGTAPLIVASTTKVTNLNADLIDDLSTQTLTATTPITLSGTTSILAAAGITIAHAATAGNIHLPTAGSANQILKNSGVAGTGAWGTVTENAGALAAVTTLAMSGQLTSTLATSTAPFVVASITKVVNFNADLLDDYEAAAFPLLAGRAGGQTIYGGTAANDDLTLEPTSHATKTTAYVLLAPSGGYVGIGVTSPTAKAQVVGDLILDRVASTTGVLRADNYSGGSGGALLVSASNTAGEQYIAFGSTPTGATGEATFTEKMRVLASGNVGIGTTGPSQKLEVNGNSSNTTSLVLSGNASNWAKISVGRTAFEFDVAVAAASGNFNNVAVAGDNVFRGGVGTTGNLILGISNTSGAVIVSTGAVGAETEKMRITNTGNVGIGTTGPASRLHTLLTDAGTDAIVNVLTLGHDTSGTAAAGFGSGLFFNLQSSTTAAQSAARITVSWNVATHASAVSDIVLAAAYNNGAAIVTSEFLRGRGGASPLAIFSADVKLNIVGNGLYIKEGSNATMGIATLALGVAVVSTTKVTANSRVFLSVESLGTILTPVAVSVTARTAGTSFTITSADLTDTSVVSWLIIEPA